VKDSSDDVQVLVTGSFGQDGRIIHRLCRELGITASGVVRSHHPAIVDPAVAHEFNSLLREGKIALLNSLSAREFRRTLAELRPTIIFHAAGVQGPATKMSKIENEKRQEMEFVHCEMTEVLLDWVSSNDENRMISLLSSKMYNGFDFNVEVTETTPLNPRGYYAETKAKAFEAIMDSRLDGRATAAILFPHTSSLVKGNFLLQEIMQQFKKVGQDENHLIKLKNVNTSVDISHAYDACREIVHVALNKKTEKFFYGSGNPTPINEIVSSFSKYLGIKEYTLVTQQENEIPYQFLSEKEVEKIITKREFLSLHDILREVAKFRS